MPTPSHLSDFINHDCPSNDISVAFLKKQLAALDFKVTRDNVSDADLANRDRVAAQYEQAKRFLCHV
jgi:NADPH-dependent glutamate synthase beta subunit-like oxidoreductase